MHKNVQWGDFQIAIKKTKPNIHVLKMMKLCLTQVHMIKIKLSIHFHYLYCNQEEFDKSSKEFNHIKLNQILKYQTYSIFLTSLLTLRINHTYIWNRGIQNSFFVTLNCRIFFKWTIISDPQPYDCHTYIFQSVQNCLPRDLWFIENHRTTTTQPRLKGYYFLSFKVMKYLTTQHFKMKRVITRC